MKRYKLTAVIWKEREGYVSKCPELGVASAGDNVEQAMGNLREAVALYLENAEALQMCDEIAEQPGSEEKYTAPFEVSIQ